MRKFLPFVRIECSECKSSRVEGGAKFSYNIGKIFSKDQLPKIAQDICCLNCNSSQLNYYDNQDKTIFLSGLSRTCTQCYLYIPQRFLDSFPKSNFCPACILSEKIEDRIISSMTKKKDGSAFRHLAAYIGKLGIEKNYWIKKAADTEKSYSAYEYAWHLSESINDEQLAISQTYFQMSIELSESKHRYAELLLNPKFKGKNPKKAVKLLKEASKANYGSSHTTLAHLYYDGEHVKQNYFTAFKYFDRASQTLQLKYLFITLWIMASRGIGVARNLPLANDYLATAIKFYSAYRRVEAKKLFSQCESIANNTGSTGCNYDLARQFLNLSIGRSPFAEELWDKSGGKIQQNVYHNEVYVSRFKDRKSLIWILTQGRFDGKFIGQIERFDKRFWVLVNRHGIASKDPYIKFRDAVKYILEYEDIRTPIRVSYERKSRPSWESRLGKPLILSLRPTLE